MGRNARSKEEVVALPIEEIDLEDRTYCFRIRVRVEDLVVDIRENGQHVPVIARRLKGHRKLQLVAGFRRATALAELERPTVKTIIRSLTDNEALQLAWSENERRCSYSDLDRAHAVLKSHQAGKTMKELETVFGLQRKQLTRLKQLASVPKVLQDALADGAIPTTHAIVVNDMKRRFPELDLRRWVAVVAEEKLSVQQLRNRITRECQSEPRPVRIMVEDEGIVRFRPIKFAPKDMTEAQRAEVLRVVERLLELVS